MPRTPVDYSKTIIYKIVCLDEKVDEIYVGHTTDFKSRKQAHKDSCNNVKSSGYNLKLYQYIRENGGWVQFVMIPVEEYPCENSTQACIKEEEIRLKLQAQLNMKKAYLSEEDRKIQESENKKQYREENKEYLTQYYKQWYEENKEHVIEKTRQYREENKERLLEQKKQYYKENKEQILEQEKQYREVHKEEISEQKKQYREAHKEQLAERGKQYREKHKEEIVAKKKQQHTCECGIIFTNCHKKRHERTKRHQAFLDSKI